MPSVAFSDQLLSLRNIPSRCLQVFSSHPFLLFHDNPQVTRILFLLGSLVWTQTEAVVGSAGCEQGSVVRSVSPSAMRRLRGMSRMTR